MVQEAQFVGRSWVKYLAESSPQRADAWTARAPKVGKSKQRQSLPSSSRATAPPSMHCICCFGIYSQPSNELRWRPTERFMRSMRLALSLRSTPLSFTGPRRSSRSASLVLVASLQGKDWHIVLGDCPEASCRCIPWRPF